MTIKRPYDMPRHISKGRVEARNREKKEQEEEPRTRKKKTKT
jgi:hypothetical protein